MKRGIKVKSSASAGKTVCHRRAKRSCADRNSLRLEGQLLFFLRAIDLDHNGANLFSRNPQILFGRMAKKNNTNKPPRSRDNPPPPATDVVSQKYF